MTVRVTYVSTDRIGMLSDPPGRLNTYFRNSPTHVISHLQLSVARALYFSPGRSLDVPSAVTEPEKNVWQDVHGILYQIISSRGFQRDVPEIIADIQHHLIELVGCLIPIPPPASHLRTREFSEVYLTLPELFESNRVYGRRDVTVESIQEYTSFLHDLLCRLGDSAEDNYRDMIPWWRMCEYLIFHLCV